MASRRISYSQTGMNGTEKEALLGAFARDDKSTPYRFSNQSTNLISQSLLSSQNIIDEVDEERDSFYISPYDKDKEEKKSF